MLALYENALSQPGVLNLIDFNFQFAEDWSTGKCMMPEHGPGDCHADRYELCAIHMLPANTSVPLIYCAYQSLPGMEGQPISAVDKVLNDCAPTQPLAKELSMCALNSTSEAWAHAAGDEFYGRGEGLIWALVDDVKVTDDSAGLETWAASVLKAICNAAAGKALPLPTACA